MINTIKYLEKLTGTYAPQSRIDKLKCIVGAPIWWYLEKRCFNKVWKNIICKEILTNDEIVDFMNRNEFSYRPEKFYKADLISSNEFFKRSTLAESKVFIQKEYSEALVELFREHIQFDIEEYVTLIVETDTEVIQSPNGETVSAKIYKVTLQFCRYFYLQKAKTYLINWFIWLSLFLGFLIIIWRLFQFILLK